MSQPENEKRFLEELRGLLDKHDVEIVGIPALQIQFNTPKAVVYDIDFICGSQEIDGDEATRTEL